MVTSVTKTTIAATLFGKARRAILSLLYGHPEESFYLRQIVRSTGIGIGPAQRELQQLASGGIIHRTLQGRQVHYQANLESPVFEELKGLINHIKVDDSAINAKSHSKDGISRQLLIEKLGISKNKLKSFCQRHHITRLSLFGSVLRPDFGPDSDVDVLVEFEPGHTPGFAIVDIENKLSALLRRKVDLRTPKDLSRYFRDQVIREARVQYATK